MVNNVKAPTPASVDKAKNLIDIFTEHRLASNLLMVIMILFGLWGFDHINTQLNPSQSFNAADVTVSWPGASAEDMETLVTRPIEHQMRGLNNLKRMTSKTTNGVSRIAISLTKNADMGAALDEIKQQVSRVRNLPADVETPLVQRRHYSEMIAGVMISGPESLDELVNLAKSYERELLALGIDKVNYRALPEEELAIQISSQTLFELGLSLDQIAGRVANLSQDVPSGTVGRGQVTRQLRGLDQQRDVQGFKQLPILNDSDGPLVALGDMADIERRVKDNQVAATRNGKPAIWLQILRNENTDTLAAAAILNQWYSDKFGDAEQPGADGIEVRIILEAWRFAKDQISLVFNNGLSGLALVILALFLFLNGRVAWWVTLGIPVSFLAALGAFYLLGGTINFLSTVGLVMALGIVVDDAIVVGEHSLAQYQAGKSPVDAARLGAGHMLSPVMASSLTTLAAFIPLVVIGEDAINEIPVLMLCVIIASIVECFLIMPGHLRSSFTAMEKKAAANQQAGKAPVGVFRQNFDARFARFREERFLPALRLALRNRRATFCSALAAFMLAISLLVGGHVKPELNLNIDFEYLETSVQFSGGTSAARKAEVVALLEQTLQQTNAQFGGDTVIDYLTHSNLGYLDHEYKSGYQYANMLAELVSPDQRDVSLDEFAAAWRERIGTPADVEVLQVSNGEDLNSDLSLYLKGGDVDTLKAAAEELALTLSAYAGVSNVYDDLPYGNEQWVFDLTTEGRILGLTATSVGRQIRAAYEGYRVQILNRQERELEVRVMLPAAERSDLGKLKQLPIVTPGGEILPLASLAEIRSRRGIDVIKHHNSALAVSVNADVDATITTPMAVIEDIEEQVLPDLLKKYGLEYGLGGSSAEDQRLLNDMLLGAVIAMALIYIILAWILASYAWPLAVMAAIPLGFTGALFGLQVMGMNLGIMSILALFTLAGVIVNDSIILVTSFKQNRDAGMEANAAIEQAACSRLRAVILTSLTTSLGLAPMMLETSPMGEMMAPLATTICFGIIYGTVLILFVIPTLLSAIESIAARRQRKRTAASQQLPQDNIQTTSAQTNSA